MTGGSVVSLEPLVCVGPVTYRVTPPSSPWILTVRAAGPSFEAANARHEHEYHTIPIQQGIYDKFLNRQLAA